MTTTKAPPGPVAHDGAGIGDAFNHDPLDFLTTCSREYGDIALLQFDRPIYLLNRADLVEQVLVDKQGLFAKEILPSDLPGGRNPQALKYEAFRGILGQNVLTADGDDWRRRRRSLAPPFHYQPTLSYIPTIVDRTARLLTRWSDGEVLEIREQMMELTLGVVSSALMGVDISTDAREEGLAFRAALDHFYNPAGATEPLE